MCVYFTFVSSTAISSLFDSSTSTQQNALLVALSFYYYYRHYYYELYIHIILFSNHYIYFCWVHSAYGPCSLSVLPPYKNQKSFFLLPDDFTKTPIKNTRYEYSYYALTTQVYFSSCKKWIIYLHIEILQNKWIWLFVWRRGYHSKTAVKFFAHFHHLFHS